MELYDIWSVNREDEARRFAAHDKITNRKLLWHGTNGEGDPENSFFKINISGVPKNKRTP